MPTTSMAELHSLGQDDQNEVQHDHVTPWFDHMDINNLMLSSSQQSSAQA